MRLKTKTRCKDCALAVPNVSEIWPSCESSGHARWKECVQTDTRCAKPRPYSADGLPADPVDGRAHNTGDKSRPHDVSSPTSAAPAGCPAVAGPMRGSPAGRTARPPDYHQLTHMPLSAPCRWCTTCARREIEILAPWRTAACRAKGAYALKRAEAARRPRERPAQRQALHAEIYLATEKA